MALSQDQVLETALELVDRDGWTALSMRRLAQQLDVWPMAIYRYFRDKNELVAALEDAASSRVPLPAHAGPWRERMHQLLSGARSGLPRHPGSRGMPAAQFSQGGLRLAEAGLEILADAGFGREEAVRAWQALFGYTLGFAGAGRTPEEPRALSALAEELAAADPEALFSFGLDRLLDGLAADLEPSRAGARAPQPGR